MIKPTKKAIFKAYLYIVIAVNIVLLLSHIINKKDGDEILLAISMNDEVGLLRMIEEGSNINYDYAYDGEAPIRLAMMLGNANIINMLINNNANLLTAGQSGFTPIDLLFSRNDVETIKLVIPNIDRSLYENALSYYMVSGLIAKAEKNVRRIKENEDKENAEGRRGRVATYIAENLANQKNIATAVSKICNGLKIIYIGELNNDPAEYLIPLLKSNPVEAAIGCLSKSTEPAINNLKRLIDITNVNSAIKLDNLDEPYRISSSSYNPVFHSKSKHGDGMRPLDIAARMHNIKAIEYLILNGADPKLMRDKFSKDKEYFDKVKAVEKDLQVNKNSQL